MSIIEILKIKGIDHKLLACIQSLENDAKPYTPAIYNDRRRRSKNTKSTNDKMLLNMASHYIVLGFLDLSGSSFVGFYDHETNLLHGRILWVFLCNTKKVLRQPSSFGKYSNFHRHCWGMNPKG